MGIKIAEVKQVADLAHIELSASELEKYGSQLDSILTYVNQLAKVKTDQASISVKVDELNNVWREDSVREWPETEVKAALDQGEIEARHVKVKKVL